MTDGRRYFLQVREQRRKSERNIETAAGRRMGIMHRLKRRKEREEGRASLLEEEEDRRNKLKKM